MGVIHRQTQSFRRIDPVKCTLEIRHAYGIPSKCVPTPRSDSESLQRQRNQNREKPHLWRHLKAPESTCEIKSRESLNSLTGGSSIKVTPSYLFS